MIYRGVTSMIGFAANPPAPVILTGYLIDDYTGAAAAYSFRKLRTAYAGSAVRIRESGGNTEADIGFSGVNFDTSAASSHIGANTGFIVTWYDQSGAGADLTNSNAALQPQYSATGISSLPSLKFDSSNDYLVTGTTAVSVGGTAGSIVCVSKFGSGDGHDGRMVSYTANGETDDWNSVASTAIICRNGSTAGIMSYRQGSGRGGASITYDTAFVGMGIYTGSAYVNYVDGSAGSSSGYSGSFGATGKITTACNVPGNGQWGGWLSEVVLWNANQTANVTGIDSNIGTYWGL